MRFYFSWNISTFILLFTCYLKFHLKMMLYQNLRGIFTHFVLQECHSDVKMSIKLPKEKEILLNCQNLKGMRVFYCSMEPQHQRKETVQPGSLQISNKICTCYMNSCFASKLPMDFIAPALILFGSSVMHCVT